MTTLLTSTLSQTSDINILFLGIGIGIGLTCGLGICLKSIWFNGNNPQNTGIQTDAWEDFSDRPSQLVSPTDYVQNSPITQDISPATTILPIKPMDINMLPNADIKTISDVNSIYLSKIQEISQLYKTEIENNVLTNTDVAYIINSYTIEQMSSSNINDTILTIITCFNG